MFNKTIEDYEGMEDPWAEMASDRVNATPELEKYYDILCDYEWDEGLIIPVIDFWKYCKEQTHDG